MAMPPAGWYPSPDHDPHWLRFWDGQQWTPHRSPVAGVATGGPVPTLAPSGLRRVDAVFAEGWLIIGSAWWPIIAASGLIWSLWSALVGLLAVVLGFGPWSRLLRDYLQTDGTYLTPAQSAEFEQRTTDLLSQTATGAWIAAGVIVVLATVTAAAAHSAAVYRLGAEAAAGRPATLGTALAGIRTGTLRLVGYGLLLALVWQLLGAVVTGAVILASGQPALAVMIGVLGFAAWIAALYWLLGRLVPAFVQASVPGGRGALGWSWQVTRSRFWAVLGRYLLWSLALSLILNVVSSVVTVPLSLAFFGVLFYGSATGWLVLLVFLASVVITAVVSGFSYVGSVPIWRDLTTDPDYRAIGPDGQLTQR